MLQVGLARASVTNTGQLNVPLGHGGSDDDVKGEKHDNSHWQGRGIIATGLVSTFEGLCWHAM